MDGNHAPGPLDAELLEKCRGVDCRCRNERVGIEQSAANDTNDNYRESAAEDLPELAKVLDPWMGYTCLGAVADGDA